MWQTALAMAGDKLFNAATDKLLGSLFGDKGPGFQAQLNDQVTANNRLTEQGIHSYFKGVTSAAKEYGIHPLYALGASPSAGSSFSVGGGDSPLDVKGMSDMGQNIGPFMHKLATKEERVYGEISARQAVERGELENELLKTQIAQIRSSMTPPVSMNNKGQIISGQEDQAIVQTPAGPVVVNKTMQSQPHYLYAHDSDGRVIRVTNPDAGDNEFLMGADFLTATLPDMAKNWARRTFVDSASRARSKWQQRWNRR